ncbi:Glutathione S-transferase, domain-containing protein [Teratosphaeria destructans]|uniref:Glutathione S-transferase, domain-containing protein n=1 Tax=Teratosphaeria destructans TaxID=418781 RepID=A0A9W7W2C2_9PEZI|nr:Glutathione S-transferase, domain-containing protein [Teratosphaeria destructans]
MNEKSERFIANGLLETLGEDAEYQTFRTPHASRGLIAIDQTTNSSNAKAFSSGAHSHSTTLGQRKLTCGVALHMRVYLSSVRTQGGHCDGTKVERRYVEYNFKDSGKMGLDIYVDPCTINCRKVLAGLALLEVPYSEKFINYFEGEQKSPDYIKINPMATIPAAVDGDCVITESNAILQYAGDLSRIENAYPKDLKQRAEVNRWLLWEASVWFSSCYTLLVENVVKPLLKSQPDQAVIDGAHPGFHKLAAVLDAQLAKTRYVAGPNVTIADIAVMAPAHLHAASQLPLEKYSNINRWIRDMESQPYWQKTQGAVNKALLPGTSANTTNGSTAATLPSHSKHKSVRSKLNYTKALNNQLTELYFYEDDEGKYKTIHEPGDDEQEVEIYDGWAWKDTFDHDRHGFSVKEFKTSFVGSWEDDEGVRSRFYPEIVQFLKQTTGAKKVLVFDHTIRTKANAAKKLTQENGTSQRAPVRLVHCDYTAESGPTRVHQLLPTEAPTLLTRRTAFLNVWKPLSKVEEMPLAMCDIQTSPPTDFFKLFLRYRERTGENYVMKYSPDHKWWYFPDMTEDQVILLKTYESEEGKARFVGHSAFEDPESRVGAPSRESIEIRTICFF